jgi:hypothetical protein
MWLRTYRSHPRNREYALTDEAKRDLETLFMACGQDKNAFFDAMETLSGSYGLNIVRPCPKANWEPPPPLKDSTGQPLPNPWTTGNKKDQDALMKADHELASHLRALAENPYAHQLKLDAAEASRVRWNKANSEYDHASNPFVSGDRAAQAAFIRACEEDWTPERKEIYLRETAPVSIPLFGPRVTQNRTVIHQIGHDGNNRLLKLILAGQERQKVIDLVEYQKAEAQRHEDAKAAERQRRAHDEVMKGIRRLPDGRTVTLPRARA